MYREFYGMKHQPFSRNVPPEALYESKAMTEALGKTCICCRPSAVCRCDSGCRMWKINLDP